MSLWKNRNKGENKKEEEKPVILVEAFSGMTEKQLLIFIAVLLLQQSEKYNIVSKEDNSRGLYLDEVFDLVKRVKEE